jgi:hypothetical protein
MRSGPAEGQGVQPSARRRSGTVLEGRRKEELERDGALWCRERSDELESE